jgi:hypothetical protein
LRSTRIRISREVVHLVGRPHLDDSGPEARGPDDLLDDDTPALLELPLAGGGAHVDDLAHPLLELLELQGAVVERARQAEPVLDEVLLAGAVAAVHRAELRDGLVRLVEDDSRKSLGEVVEQRGGGSPAFRPERCRL